MGNDPANYGDPSGEQKAGPDDFALPGQLIKWQMVVEPSDDPEGGSTVIFVPTSFMPYAVTNTLQKRILSAAQTTMRMDSKLEATINDLSSDCLNSLGALGQEFGQVVGRTNLAAYVQNLNFYSGTGGEGLLTLAQAGLPSDVKGSGETILSFASTMAANADTLGYTQGSNYTVTTSIILKNSNVNGMTLLQEELHSMFQKDDPDIVRALGNIGYTNDSSLSASQNFSTWLNDKCGK